MTAENQVSCTQRILQIASVAFVVPSLTLVVLLVVSVAVLSWCTPVSCKTEYPLVLQWHHVLLKCVMVVFGCWFVVFDWREVGPTIAIQNAVAAGFLAWIMMAAWVIDSPFLDWLVDACTLACLVFVVLYVAGSALKLVQNPKWGLILALATSASGLYLASVAYHVIAEALRPAILFVGSFVVVRSLRCFEKIRHWEPVTQLDPNTEEYQERLIDFRDACALRQDKYDFELNVLNVYAVRKQTNLPEDTLLDESNAQDLFHGTRFLNAKGIVCDGFRLPDHRGMFGKGIYFADTPSKAMQYTSTCSSTFWMCLPEWVNRIARSVSCHGRIILLCHVQLGRQREARSADPQLQGYDHNSWWAWLTGRWGAYDSVVGIEREAGGVLRSPEYVIYNPQQARVDYIFEVWASYRAAE